MVTVRFNGHMYETALRARIRWHWKRARGVNETPKPKIISHGEGCCGYWISEPDSVYRAVLNDMTMEDK